MAKVARKPRVSSAPAIQWKAPTPTAQRNIGRLAGLLQQRDDWLKIAIEEAIFDDVDGSTFCDAKIHNASHRARIAATATAKGLVCPHCSLLHYFGDGLLCLPFTATFDAEIRYPINQADFAALPGERKRRATMNPKAKPQGICAEACRLQLKALVMLEIDAKGRKRMGGSLASHEDLLRVVKSSGVRVGAVRALRIVSFINGLQKA